MEGFVARCLALGMDANETEEHFHKYANNHFLTSPNIYAGLQARLNAPDVPLTKAAMARYLTPDVLAVAVNCRVKYASDLVSTSIREQLGLPEPSWDTVPEPLRKIASSLMADLAEGAGNLYGKAKVGLGGLAHPGSVVGRVLYGPKPHALGQVPILGGMLAASESGRAALGEAAMPRVGVGAGLGAGAIGLAHHHATKAQPQPEPNGVLQQLMAMLGQRKQASQIGSTLSSFARMPMQQQVLISALLGSGLGGVKRLAVPSAEDQMQGRGALSRFGHGALRGGAIGAGAGLGAASGGLLASRMKMNPGTGMGLGALAGGAGVAALT